jgi:SAM-dependent methyltransferase
MTARSDGSSGQDEELADEFDVAAAWTADSIVALGPANAIPGACRGSGGPAALAWLAEWLRLGPGVALLDVGGGLGGPAAWATEERGARPVLAEPMVGAVRAARRLFDLPAVVAPGERLPVADASFPAVWALGVLSTTTEKEGVVAEVRRVLTPDGRAGLVAYVAEGPVDDAPEGNTFPTPDELRALLTGGGLDIVETVAVADLPADPDGWKRREQQVQDDLAERHGGDERWERAQADEERVATLIEEGRVTAYAIRLGLSAAPR